MYVFGPAVHLYHSFLRKISVILYSNTSTEFKFSILCCICNFLKFFLIASCSYFMDAISILFFSAGKVS